VGNGGSGSGTPSGSTTSGTSGGTSTSQEAPLTPTQFSYDPARDSIFYFYVPSLTGKVLISLTVPLGATNVPTTFLVESLSTPAQVSLGDIDLEVRALRKSDGFSIVEFNKALDLHYWTQFVDSVPRLVEDGVIGLPMALLGNSVLPTSISSGYFVYSDRTYSVLTRTLSKIYFDLIQSDLELRARNVNLKVGDEIQLQYSGGSGTGLLQFASENPEVCSVTLAGVVKAIKPGLCTVTVIKSADSSHLAITSNSLTFLVSLTSNELRSQNSLRNQLLYAVPSKDYQVLVNLASNYANKTGTIQIRRYERGILVYRTLGSVTLNSNGNAVYYGKNSLLTGTRLRLVVDGVIMAYATAK
jgi:hypothetical protein